MASDGNSQNKGVSEEEYKRRQIQDITPIEQKRAEQQASEGFEVQLPPEEEEITDEVQGEAGDEESQTDLNPDDAKRALEKTKKYNETPEEQLSENKVPDYSQKQYERPPGGKSIEPKVKGGGLKPSGAVDSGAKTVGKEAGGAAKKGAQAAVDAAGQAIKKAAAQAAKWAAQLATKALASTAEYWFPILMIVVAVIIIIFAIFMLIRAWNTPNVNGASPVIAADILTDHPLIETVLSMSNSADFQKLMTDNKDKLIGEINSFKVELNTRYGTDPKTPGTIDQLDKILELIAAYTTPDTAKAKEIRDKLVAAVKPWSLTLNPDGLVYPARGYSAAKMGRGWGSAGGTHRGSDAYMPIGTVYRAPASGVVVYLRQDIPNYPAGSNHFRDGFRGNYAQNYGFGNTIIVRIEGSANPNLNGKAWEIHHISPNSVPPDIKVGSTVYQGQIVAKSGHNGMSSKEHIHFQIDKQVCGGASNPSPCGASAGLNSTVNPFDPSLKLIW